MKANSDLETMLNFLFGNETDIALVTLLIVSLSEIHNTKNAFSRGGRVKANLERDGKRWGERWTIIKFNCVTERVVVQYVDIVPVQSIVRP